MRASQLTPQDLKKLRALPWSLAGTVLNNFFYIWTFGGSIFLLFLHELELPKDQIGLMLSFFPFTGLLALATSSLVARWGRKRVFLLGYGIRKPVMASLLLLPWLLAHAGRGAALGFLYAIILIVATLRATAETAYYPWLQEFVPNAVRGKFGAANSILTMLGSSVALAIASRVIGSGTGLGGYMTLIGIGAAVGFIGIMLQGFVPGGAPVKEAGSSRAHFAGLAETLRDRNFVYTLGGVGSSTLGTVMLAGFLPLYVKEQVGLPSSTVVLMDIAFMAGGVLASLFSGVLADRVGSRPVLMPNLTLVTLVPLGWLLAPRHAPNAAVLCGALYFVYGALTSGAGIGAGRLLFNGVIPPEKNTSYTAVYYAWMGLTGGITPLLAGALLSGLAGWQFSAGPFSLDAYRLLFLLSLVGFTVSALLYRKVRPDGEYSTRTALRKFFDNL